MSLPLIQICSAIGAEQGNIPDIEITGIADLREAGSGEITFLSNPRYSVYLETTQASAVIVSGDTAVPENVLPIRVADPYFAFMTVLELFNKRTPRDFADGLDPKAAIHLEAVIGKDVSVGPFAFIGKGVKVGDGTFIGPGTVILKDSSVGEKSIIYPNVTIMDGCIIGKRAIIHSGAVIGADGFGFAPHADGIKKIPQIGKVRIGDDVEIGANTCIDRAAFGETIVENGTKIDNLVQIAHNVHVGQYTVMASQTGIAGSTTIGNGVKIGGQAGLTGHIKVSDGASIGAQAGVTKDVAPGETVSGYPAKPHFQALREEALIRNLPDLYNKIKAQEERIKELERLIKDRS